MPQTRYIDSSPDNRSYMASPEINPGFYDGTSSDSSASSPINCNGYDTVYGGNSFMSYPTFPMQYIASGDYPVPVGLIPVELDIEGLYEDHDRRRKKNAGDKPISSHVHSRRRAQNRASQRAFRDRKEKHMRDLELRLGELESRHSNLTTSYESLQAEHASVRQELEALRKENARLEGVTGVARGHNSKGWDDSKVEILDPLLFDVSAFCFDQDEGEGGTA